MTVAVFAAPYSPPIPELVWRPMRHTFTAWDGQVWDLSDPAGGVLLTDAGIRGLDDAPVADFVSEAAGVDGQQHLGFRALAREPFWPVLVWSDQSSRAWVERDAAWWRALLPGRVGTWTVQTPWGSSRHLRVRRRPDGGHVFGIDPVVRGWEVYGIELIADDPFWAADPVRITAGEVEPVDFIDPAGAPPFHITGGRGLSGLTIDNPGDIAAWPVWEAVGPHPDLTVGIGGAFIECPVLEEGQQLVIDTSPWVRTALVDGVDVTASLGQAEFARVPAGGSQPLTTSSTGAGSVSCTLTPRWWRAW